MEGVYWHISLLILAIPFIFWYLKKQNVGGTIKHAPFYVKFLCLSTIFGCWFGLSFSLTIITEWGETNMPLFYLFSPLLFFILISKIDIIFNKKPTRLEMFLNSGQLIEENTLTYTAKFLWFNIERPFLIVLGVLVGGLGAIFIIVAFGFILWDGISNLETERQIIQLMIISGVVVFWMGLKPVNEEASPLLDQ
jgi:hypothetical protein